MVGWTRPVDGVHVTPVTQAGARKGTDVAFEGGSSDVSLASDGSDFLAVWQSSNGTSTAARISAAGADLDPSGIALGLATHARVTVDGFEYLVVFDAGQVIGARLTSTGRVFDTFSIALQGGSPSVVGFDGLPALVAYERRGRVTARLISATCGDAMLDPDEGCDDGNLLAHDGCNSLCQVEPGFMCTGSPSICQPFSALCGNVILCDPNAMCSSGPNGPTCICDQGYVGNGLACELQGSGGTGCGCAAHDGVPRDLPIVLALLAIGSRRRRKARPRSRR